MKQADLQTVKKAAIVIKALNNAHRMKIVGLLHEGNKTGRELREALGLKKGHLDNHLTQLRNVNLLRRTVDKMDTRARIYMIDRRKYARLLRICRVMVL